MSNNEEIIYFELNNWFAGRDYPDAEPFLSWMGNDLSIKFRDKDWLIENELCVLCGFIDMSQNFLITAKKSWVEENCPELLTKYREFLRFPEDEDDDEVYGRFGQTFLEYAPYNIGLTWFEEDDDYYEDDDDEDDNSVDNNE